MASFGNEKKNMWKLVNLSLCFIACTFTVTTTLSSNKKSALTNTIKARRDRLLETLYEVVYTGEQEDLRQMLTETGFRLTKRVGLEMQINLNNLIRHWLTSCENWPFLFKWSYYVGQIMKRTLGMDQSMCALFVFILISDITQILLFSIEYCLNN